MSGFPALRGGSPASDGVNENVITYHDVILAADRFGFDERGCPPVVIDAAEIIGRMTGLDMAKYDLASDFDAMVWRLVRKPDA